MRGEAERQKGSRCGARGLERCARRQFDDTIVEVAAVMARLRCPLIAVMKDRELVGVITASRLLAAALQH